MEAAIDWILTNQQIPETLPGAATYTIYRYSLKVIYIYIYIFFFCLNIFIQE